jgi:hypothetical protein
MNGHLASRDLGFQGNIIHVKPAKRTNIWVGLKPQVLAKMG